MIRPITQADAVLAVYYENVTRYWLDAGLIFAAWPDGHLIWTPDRLEGGPPYYAATIDPQTVTATLTRFEEEGLFAYPDLSRCSLGPHSYYQVIFLQSGENRLKMASDHEIGQGPAEEDRFRALVELKDRPRVEALAAEPAWYLHYQLIWCELRRSLEGLIPPAAR